MSTLEVDKIIPQGSGTALQIGENGDTITLPAGTTITLPSGSISNSELANNIAIKGGTTEAGIKIMKNNDIHKILLKTLLSAYQKANLLGKK